MESCSFTDKLGAYHDGQLDAAASAEIEKHLTSCPACTAELAELRKMSQWFAQEPEPHLSQMSLYRLHQQTQRAMEVGMVRLARAISAVAACILVASSMWLVRTNEAPAPVEPVQTTAGVPPWVDVTVAANRDTASVDTTTPAAAWYLASASVRSDDMP
jgi:anti-sigma factor RsiW